MIAEPPSTLTDGDKMPMNQKTDGAKCRWSKIRNSLKYTSANERFIGYTKEFKDCITNGDERALSDLMLKPDFTRHLEGFRLFRKESKSDYVFDYDLDLAIFLKKVAKKSGLTQEDEQQKLLMQKTVKSLVLGTQPSPKFTIVSTPLLDLVKKWPKVAGRVFYQLMTLNMSDKQPSISGLNFTGESMVSFHDFQVGNLSKAKSVQFDYHFFDPARIQKWHNETTIQQNNKLTKYKLRPLSKKQLTRLNPLYWVIDKNMSFLTHHVYITEYVFLKLRQYHTYYFVLFHLIFQM